MRKKMRPMKLMVTMVVGLLLTAGCGSSRDERLVAMAQQNIAEQVRQNERMAAQSVQIAEASKRLVEADSKARQEMLQAQAALQDEIQGARNNVDRQRDLLESERREIADQRYRDPIVAESIGAVGLTIACLLPLMLAGYVVHCLRHTVDSDEALSELLVMELAGEQPGVLTSSLNQAARIEHRPLIESEQSDHAISPDDEPPFCAP
jgi:uncharacterized protein YcfL